MTVATCKIEEKLSKNGRKIYYIDVSNMTEKELCSVLGVKYVPWYKSAFFWAYALLFSMHSLMMLFNAFVNK